MKTEDTKPFTWTAELIAEVAADMDRGWALLAQSRWSPSLNRYIPAGEKK